MKILIGNILKSKAQTLVNTVNCVGIMGKGIALEFKNVVAHAKTSFDALIESIAAVEFVGEPLGLPGDEGKDVAEKVVNDMKAYRSEIHKRIMPHLDQITSEMESFEVESF